MSTVIDLAERRGAREQPDAEHVRQDEYGRPLYRFGLEYQHDGAAWMLDLWAYDDADAHAKAASIGQGVRVVGQIFTTVPA